MLREIYKQNIAAGEKIWTDFGYRTAPTEQGIYTLYMHSHNNTFIGWEWKNEISGSIYKSANLW